MAIAFAAVAAVLVADFVVAVRRARNEWRTGDDLSRSTGWLISTLYFLVAALLVLAVVWRPLPLGVPPAVALAIGGVLVLGGVGLAVPALVPFASIRQLYGVDRGDLITGGVYRYSRNPQYTGIGLALVGGALIARSGLALLVAATYWPAVRTWLLIEERHLQAVFGAEYLEYRERAPRFLGLPRGDSASTER